MPVTVVVLDEAERRAQLVKLLTLCTWVWTGTGSRAAFSLLVAVGDYNRNNPDSPIGWAEVRAHALVKA